MGSKMKGWHDRGPKKEKRRMFEETSGRKPQFRDRRDRKPNESKRVDLNRLPEQDF